MTPVVRALWFIESNYARELTLDEIAEIGGVSRFHMSRAFGAATGLAVSRYVRGRRLTVAARSLANGAPDILGVALEAGYGSHEAFTRAFRDQFGLTPEQVRTQRHLDNLKLVEPIRMDTMDFVKLEPPRFENGKALLLAGLAEHYTGETMAGIPGLWQRFAPYLGSIPGGVGKDAYGVVISAPEGSEGFEYMAGVEVADISQVPKEFRTLRIPARRYAVFQHRGHVSDIRKTMHAIWNKWLPQSGHEAAGNPDFFEKYGEAFDPRTGLGGLEVWLPVKA